MDRDQTMKPTLPADLFTHAEAWRRALAACRDASPPPTEGQNDAAYWAHELSVFDRVMGEVTAYRDGVTPEVDLSAPYAVEANRVVPPGMVIVTNRENARPLFLGAAGMVSRAIMESWPAGAVMSLNPADFEIVRRRLAVVAPSAPPVGHG